MRRYRESRGQGDAYGAANVRRFVARLRRDEVVGPVAGAGARAKATRVPSARRVALHPARRIGLGARARPRHMIQYTY